MSFDIIPGAFRADIIAALRERSLTLGHMPQLEALIAGLEAGDFSSNNIAVVTGRMSGSDEDSMLFVDHRVVDPAAALLHVDAATATVLINNDKAYVDSTDLTYHLIEASGSKFGAYST